MCDHISAVYLQQHSKHQGNSIYLPVFVPLHPQKPYLPVHNKNLKELPT
jgi:hypothetical protein